MCDFLYLKDGKRFVRVSFSDILYVEADNKYCYLITQTRKHLVCQSLNLIERSLPARIFCRIHRSYILSLNHITEFDQESATIGAVTLPIGKQYKNSLTGRLITFQDDDSKYVKLNDFDKLNLFWKVKPN